MELATALPLAVPVVADALPPQSPEHLPVDLARLPLPLLRAASVVARAADAVRDQRADAQALAVRAKPLVVVVRGARL